MIIIKNDKEIDLMRKAGKIVAETLLVVEKNIKPGITTAELDRIAEEFITKHGAKPSFKGLYGFPASLCISVNEQVVHGIPGRYVLKEGDILISLTGNVGRVSLCKDGDYLLNQRVGLLQLAKNVNQEFLYQILSSQKFENSMIACGQGAAQMNIGKGDVESYVLPYSSNGNNILWIAKILHSYDECIIKEQRRLTLLTMQKQYLLTQMFI